MAPFIIGFIFIFFCVTYAPLEYQDYVFDPVGEFLGWMMVVAALIPIPTYMVFFVLRRAKGTLLEVFFFFFLFKFTWCMYTSYNH